MDRIDLDRDWQFYEADEADLCARTLQSQTVDLPHDYIIRKPRRVDSRAAYESGYFDEGEGVYRKVLENADDWKDKTVLLDVDGAYALVEVALNREVLAVHPNGFTPFQVDLTSALRFDGRKNILKIITQVRNPSCRWYTGGGLYRDVCLWIGNKIFIKPWDLFITTPDVNEQEARVCLEYVLSYTADNKGHSGDTGCENEYHDPVIRISVIDQEQHTAARIETKDLQHAELKLKNPHLWCLEDPYLYVCRIEILADGQVTDTTQETFGIRCIAVSAQDGFCLNGKPLKIKGGCIHGDNGLLGAVSIRAAENRKIRILKKAGYNTVRISHNPPSRILLEECDRQGMLLMDEAFDCWNFGKKPMDYHLFFRTCWEQDIESMVRQARNHPCVITWSIGNEIMEANGMNQGACWSKRLSDKVRRLDPTRPVLAACCSLLPDLDDGKAFTNIDANQNPDSQEEFLRRTEEFLAPLDIVGLNYLPMLYEPMHNQYPERIILGTESYAFSTWDNWKAVEDKTYVLGDCIWAAVDYLGEIGGGEVKWSKEDTGTPLWEPPYPWRTSWQSDIDLTGEARPQSVYRQIMWGKRNLCGIFTTHPGHTGDTFTGTGWHWYDVDSCWDFDDQFLGHMVKVDVYGAGETAELFLNGKSLGERKLIRQIASFEVPYERGELRAVVYEEPGGSSSSLATRQVLAESILCSSGSFDHYEMVAEGAMIEDVQYFRILAVDAGGHRIMNAQQEITVHVQNGELIAGGNGSPCSPDAFYSDTFHLYRGTAIAIVKCRNDHELPALEVSTVLDSSGTL